MAARQLVTLVGVDYKEGDDIEEHLQKLDDIAELMVVDDLVKYQAILLSLDEDARAEFNAFLKVEEKKKTVQGKPEELKRLLLEKFQMRKTQLERIEFITQPRRRDKLLVVDLQERMRVYIEFVDEMAKNKEKLLVDMALQLLHPDDRADYCNLNPVEEKRDMGTLIEFVRRRENEKLRDEKYQQGIVGKPKKSTDESMRSTHRDAKSTGESMRSTHRDAKTTKIVADAAKQKKTSTGDSTRSKNWDEEDDDEAAEERMRLRSEGRCFICRKVGHIARMCPTIKKNDQAQQRVETINGLEEARRAPKKVRCSYYDPDSDDEDSSGEEEPN